MYTYDRTARVDQDQLDSLAQAVASSAGEVVKGEVKGVVKKIVSKVLSKDKDGSLLGVVYHDMYNRSDLVQLIEKKLTDAKTLTQIVDLLVDELEDQR